MPYGVIGFKTWEAQSGFLPSPAVWADAQGEQAKIDGVGYHVIADFKNARSTEGLLNQVLGTASGLSYDVNYDSVLKLSTGSGNTANGTQLVTRPLGIPALNSQNKMKMEAIVARTTATTTQADAAFIGFALQPGLSTQFVITASSTAASNAYVSTSAIGFLCHGDSQGSTFDAVYQNLNTGVSTVLKDVLQSSALTSSSTQPQYGGAGTGQGTAPPAAGSMTTSTFHKFGLSYDGVQFWTWYVDGIQVAKLSAIGTTDNVDSYGALICIAAPGSTAATYNLAYFRAGFAPGT